MAQLKTLENFKGKPVFIPGNHDWYSDGNKGLKRQEKFVEKYLDAKDVFLPENGCPIEEQIINDDLMVLYLDSHWYVENWNKFSGINAECEIKTRSKFLEEVGGIIKKNREKTIVIAIHHPMMTNGSHGGHYSFHQHLFPTGGAIPLPVVGSLACLLRRSSGCPMRTSNTNIIENYKIVY